MVRVVNTQDGQFVLSMGDAFLRRALTSSPNDHIEFELDSKPNCFAVHHNHLVVGCDDGSVKLYSVENHSFERDLYGGTTPIISVDFSYDGKQLAIVSHDKSCLVDLENITKVVTVPILARHLAWNPATDLVACAGQDSSVYYFRDDKLETKMQSVLPTVALDEDNRSTSVCWSPSGDVFAIPSKSLDLVVYDREECLEQCRIILKEPVSVSKWSPNGRYIACLMASGQIYVWSVGDRSMVSTEKKQQCAYFDWHPHLNSITIVTQDGTISSIVPVPEPHPSPVGQIISNKLEFDVQNTKSQDEELILSGSEDEFDMGVGADDEDLFEERPSKRTRFDEVKQAFQSGSTPWTNRKRILCTNYVGYVWSTYQDDEHNTITVTFFDQGTFRDYHFEDENKFSLAALGTKATVLANNKGKVFVRLHESRIDSWEYNCNEPVRSAAVSDKIVVLCTESGIVRILSIYGNAISITRESRDPVVTCAAHDNTLMIIRHGCGGPNYTIEDVVSQRYYQKNDPVDVPPNAELTALFFNDNGDPCIGDSNGTICTLINWRDPAQARWVPVFDSQEYSTIQERQQLCWPIGIFGHELLCIVLKNQKTFPQIPLPVTSQVELKIPGIDGHEQSFILKSVAHRQYSARATVLEEGDELKANLTELVEESESEMNMFLLKQLQEACTANQPNKCLSIASLISTDEALQIAAQIAARYNLQSVVERIEAQIS